MSQSCRSGSGTSREWRGRSSHAERLRLGYHSEPYSEEPMRQILLLLLLTGCAPQWQWKHPHGDQAQFNRDVAQCEYEGAQATASYSHGATARTTSGAISQGIGEGL